MLARLLALGLCAVGAGALFAPASSSRGYGLPSSDPAALALIRAMGVRDVVLGLIVGSLSNARSRDVLAGSIAATALVAAGDFSIVSQSETPEARTALKVHGGGIAGLLLLWAIVRAGR